MTTPSQKELTTRLTALGIPESQASYDEGWQRFEALTGDASLGWRVMVTQSAEGVREVGLHETFGDLDPTKRGGQPPVAGGPVR